MIFRAIRMEPNNQPIVQIIASSVTIISSGGNEAIWLAWLSFGFKAKRSCNGERSAVLRLNVGLGYVMP